MALTGDMACAEQLLHPARIVVKEGTRIHEKPLELRTGLWNEIRINQEKFLHEECGSFLVEIDLHMRSQFDYALLILAAAFHKNGEDLPRSPHFSPDEIRMLEGIERYDIFEILTDADIKNRILHRDTGILSLLREYYGTMDAYVQETLENPEIRLPLRYYLKRRWTRYRGKMDDAIAELVIKHDWMRALVAAWERDRGEGRS